MVRYPRYVVWGTDKRGLYSGNYAFTKEQALKIKSKMKKMPIFKGKRINIRKYV